VPQDGAGTTRAHGTGRGRHGEFAGNFYMGLYHLDRPLYGSVDGSARGSAGMGSAGVGAYRRLDVRCFEEREKAAALLHCTGSGVFNRYMQRGAAAGLDPRTSG